MKINDWAVEIHENAVEHGWWEQEREIPEIIALCHSELSEALESYRNDEPMYWESNGKPEGIATELVDCVIRVFDFLAHEGINIEDVLEAKHEYNKSRPYKHGGKKC